MSSALSPANPPLREVRQLAATVATAEDGALLRLVRLLDDLPERGPVDRVLESARQRLLTLKPRRPLRFARLLFLPLDGAIVTPTRWRRGGHEVPRSALASIAHALDDALGLAAAGIRRDAEGHGMEDVTMVGALGARLWPLAAGALPDQPPARWGSSGLSREDYAVIRDIMAPVLAAGAAIHAALRSMAERPPAGASDPVPDLLREALAGPAAAGPRPLAAASATLLRGTESPGAVLHAVGEFGEVGRSLARGMADLAIAMLPDPDRAELATAAAEAQRFFSASDDLAASGLLDPERLRRLQGQRHTMDQACRRMVAEAGATHVVGPLASLRHSGASPDKAVLEIERDARAIRALSQAARGASDPAAHDRLLRQITTAVGQLAKGRSPDSGLTMVDFARLVEILDGPEAAMTLLAEAPRQ
jgi:hypothetical protein